jgi:methionine sulfoxide reductase catalytic subunit
MISFDAAHKGVHYPADRRFRVWVRPSILIGIAAVIALLLLAALIEFGLVGLPYVLPVPQVYPNNFAGPHGFPLWLRYCHFFNFLFVMMLIRSGLSIPHSLRPPEFTSLLPSGLTAYGIAFV